MAKAQAQAEPDIPEDTLDEDELESQLLQTDKLDTPEQIVGALDATFRETGHTMIGPTLASPDRHVLQTTNSEGRRITITAEYSR